MVVAPNHLAVDLYSGDVVQSFPQAYAAGVRLIILKATEGATYRDKTFDKRLADARASGMLVGAYHFMRATPVDQQVANFLSAAKPDASMRLVMDWETLDATPDMARDFLRRIDAETGQKTIVYSYSSFLKERLGSSIDPVFADHPLWIAAYSSRPPVLQASWTKYLLWQNTESARIPGIPGVATGVDASHFDGTEDELRRAWLEGGPIRVPDVATSDTRARDGARAIVKNIQSLLADGDLYSAGIDGDLGPLTRKAIDTLAERAK